MNKRTAAHLCRERYPTTDKNPTTDKKKMKKLRAWVKKGKAWAQSALASHYLLGAYGLPQSYLMALKLYRMAVKQGEGSGCGENGGTQD